MPRGWRKHSGYDWNAFGAWVRASRRQAGWTQSQLAAKLRHTRKWTLSRVESGGQGLSSEDRETVVNALAEALEPDISRASRRDFIKRAGLQLAGLAIAGSLGSASGLGRATHAPDSRAGTSLSRERIELEEQIYDLGVGLTETWDVCLYQGHAHLVAREAGRRYQFLARSDYLGDRDYALTAIRVGIRLARAQEAISDWYARGAVAIRTYTDIEERIIARFAGQLPGERDITREYAQLLALRAALHREKGALRQSAADLRRCITLARRLNNTLLHVDALCELAHVWIACGRQDMWERLLDEARDVARAAPDSQREGLFALITYYVGAGERRLAFDEVFGFPEQEKARQAESAIRNLRASQAQLGANWSKYVLQGDLAGHPLITLVSAAQCAIWTEPEHVEQEFEELKPRIASELPYLMGKIRISESWPAVLRQWPAHNPPPFFDLSGKRDAHGRTVRRP